MQNLTDPAAPTRTAPQPVSDSGQIAWRPLGRSGIDVPLLGYGVAGPLGSSLIRDEDAIALIRAAYQGGASLFDTSPFYGRAELRLAAALKDAPRSSYRLVTKAGTHWRMGVAFKDFSVSAIRRSLEGSLKRLGVSGVDVLLLHGPCNDPFTPELKRAIAGWKREGLIGAFGITARRGDEIHYAIRNGFADVIQAPVFEGPETGGSWSEVAAADGVGFLGIESLRAVAAPVERLESGVDFWHTMRALKQRRRFTPGDAAATLRRALQLPGVSSVIVGAARLGHLEANLAVARELS